MPADPTIDDPEQVTLLDQCARFTDELAADDGVLSATPLPTSPNACAARPRSPTTSACVA